MSARNQSAQTAVDPEQRFSDWQRSLTQTSKTQKAAEIAGRQEALISSVYGGSPALADYLQAELQFDIAATPVPQLFRRLTASEFRNPTFALEREVAALWQGQIHASDASRPSFWTRAHAGWIADGKLAEPLYYALLGRLDTGAEENTAEASTRNLLRRLGGLPHVRGSVSVLSDCPLSRAWWRHRLAVDAAQHAHGEFDAETAHRVLHSHNDAWARLVGDSVRRITVVNHSRLRAALIYHYRECSRDGQPLPPHELQNAVRRLAQRGPSLAFDVLEWKELLQITADAIGQARESLKPDPTPVSP